SRACDDRLERPCRIGGRDHRPDMLDVGDVELLEPRRQAALAQLVDELLRAASVEIRDDDVVAAGRERPCDRPADALRTAYAESRAIAEPRSAAQLESATIVPPPASRKCRTASRIKLTGSSTLTRSVASQFSSHCSSLPSKGVSSSAAALTTTASMRPRHA